MSYDMQVVDDIETVEYKINEGEGFDYFFTHYVGPSSWVNAPGLARAHQAYEAARSELVRVLRTHGVKVEE